MYTINKERTKENSHHYAMYLDGRTGQKKTAADLQGPEAQHIVTVDWYLAPKKGKTRKKISDSVLRTEMKGRKGKARAKQETLAGTSEEIEFCESVVRIEGLQRENGNPINKVDSVVYDWLDSWMIDDVQEELEKMSGITSEDVEEVKGE